MKFVILSLIDLHNFLPCLFILVFKAVPHPNACLFLSANAEKATSGNTSEFEAEYDNGNILESCNEVFIFYQSILILFRIFINSIRCIVD